MSRAGWSAAVAAVCCVSTAEGQDTVTILGSRTQEQSSASGALGQKNLLDTPFSITVVDGQDIYRRQANSLGKIFANDPSIFSADASATTAWWGAQIRGLGVRNYYVDGVPVLLSWGGEFPLESIESVEALKGLTGFMYGFGEPGGVISYKSKRPTDEPMLSTSVGYRNAGVLDGHLDAGGRLGESQGLGYRVNVAGQYGEAYNSADVNRNLASLALDCRFGSGVTWYFNALHEDSKLKHEPLYFYWDMYEGRGGLPRPTYRYDDVNVDNSWYKAETLKGSTGVRWEIDQDWNADVVVGYTRKDHKSNKMFGYVLNDAGDYEGEAYNFGGLLKNTFAQAIVQGSIGSDTVRHELVFGTSFQRSTGRWSNDWYWSNDFNGNLYEAQPFRITRDLDFSLGPVSEDERQVGVFASDTVHFGSHWQVIAGVRYTDYESKDMDRDPEVESGYATEAISPTFALIYKPVSHTSIYASYVESLEAGTRVGDTYANFGEILDATISKQYEVGAKYGQDRLSFTTAAFRVERAAQIDQFRDELRYLTRDGLTQYEGLEAIVRYGISRDLTLGAGATYLDATIEKVSEANQALAGHTPAGAARLHMVGSADYRVRAVPGLSVYGNMRYFDDAYYEDANIVVIPNRTLASVGFQYQTAWMGRSTLITGSVHNLFNKKYWDMNTLGEGMNGALSMRVSW